MKYWLNLGGEKTYGPYEVDRLRIFQSEGKLGASAQLCQEGGMQWVPAASVLGPTNTVAPPPLRLGVQGEFELAPFGKRAGAIIIDGLILSMGNWLIDRVALEFVANVLGSWERAGLASNLQISLMHGPSVLRRWSYRLARPNGFRSASSCRRKWSPHQLHSAPRQKISMSTKMGRQWDLTPPTNLSSFALTNCSNRKIKLRVEGAINGCR